VHVNGWQFSSDGYDQIVDIRRRQTEGGLLAFEGEATRMAR
jgi:hypothetical protein